MPTSTHSRVLGWLAILCTLAVAVAGCAAVSGLDELEKVDCTENCGAGGNGNAFDLKCTSTKQCGMTDACCGHVNAPSQYSSACEPVANCVMGNGIRLCADSDDCGGTPCEVAPTFPDHPQCK